METILIVAADHPSLDGDVERFVSDLRSETRRFGPRARCNPKPFPSLIAALRERGGFRLAAVECGRIVGLVRVDIDDRGFIAVAPGFRGRGIGTQLGRAAIDRASERGHSRVVIRSNRRSSAIRRIGEELSCTVVDGRRGRIDLLIPVPIGATGVGVA